MKISEIKSLIILILFLCQASMQAQSPPVISYADNSSPNAILPDVPSMMFSANNIPSSAWDFLWQTNCSSGTNSVTIGNNSALSTTLSVPKATSCGVFTLSFHYKTGGGSGTPHTLTYSVAVLPYLVPNSNFIYPGETVTVTLANVGNFSSICSGPFLSWNAINGLYTPFGLNGIISCPSTGFSSAITVNCIISNCPAIGTLNKNLTPITLSVKLRDPVINGPSTIGCNGSSSASGTTYSASQVPGAAYYIWQYPITLFNAIGTTTGQVLNLSANEVGFGTITVQAFNGQGGVISSAVVSKQVQVCCIGSRTLATLVNAGNSPYRREAVSKIVSTNTITATGAATFHAGDEVQLLAGFEAIQGCEVHVYNDGCSGNYSRIAYLEEEANGSFNLDETSTHKIVLEDNYSDATGQSVAPSLDFRQRFSIAPNPAADEVYLTVYEKKSVLLYISIYDLMGNKISDIKRIPNQMGYKISLSNLPGGAYSLRLTFNDYSTSKIIVKQNY